MNGDDDHDVDPKEVMTPVELLESVTLGCIETLRRKRVCLYPGPHLPVQPNDFTNFGQCVPYLGDCNALIFCAPFDSKADARARIQHYAGGGDPALVLDRDECVGLDHEYDWIWRDDLLFPNKSDHLLVARPAPDAEPQATRPPDDRFWGHYVILKITGRHDKLYLLHLGLRGDHAWPYFLAPHGIGIARMIANPD